MTSTTIPSAATTGAAAAASERRLRGQCLIVGAALIGALIEVGVLGFSWFPALTGRSVRPSRAVAGQAGRREVVHVHRAARAVGGVRAASGPAALSW